MADVFISYHEKSAGEIVRQIADALESVGISCWYAERDLTDPGAFAATITNEIRACKVFLLVLNEGSNQSEHVKNEVSLAFARISKHEQMHLICFKVDNCILSDDMAYYLHRQQMMSGNPPDQKRIQKLAEQIAGILRGLPTWKMIHEREKQIRELKLAQTQQTQILQERTQVLDLAQAEIQQLKQEQARKIGELEWARKQIKYLKQKSTLYSSRRWQLNMRKLNCWFCLYSFLYLCVCALFC